MKGRIEESMNAEIHVVLFNKKNNNETFGTVKLSSHAKKITTMEGSQKMG